MLPPRNPSLRRALGTLLATVTLTVTPVVTPTALAAGPAQAGPAVVEQDVTFSGSGGPTLHGTVLAPAEPAAARRPAMVMVHGSGRVSRDGYRAEAEAFARSGIVTLIYDKRPKASRSDVDFGLLADDALAGLRALRSRADVDPDRVGLWGVSEGGWVAPLAASRTAEVAFVVTVGAAGVAPERQQSWNLVNRLAAAGVSGSLVDTVSRTALGLVVGAGLFPEAGYDPAPVLARVTRPVLGLWGELDRVVPGAESLRLFRESLDAAGNRRYALGSVPGADHTMRLSPDGFRRGDEVSPAYLERVSSWVHGLAGTTAAVEVGTPARQERDSAPVEPGSPAAHLVAVAVLLVAFGGYGAGAAVRRLRGRRGAPPARRAARVLATTGLLAVLGLFAYLGQLSATNARNPGAVLLGRPLPWLGLQLLAVAVVVAAMITAWGLWRARSEPGHRLRLGLLVAGGVVFVPWAVHWGLLLP
ncbi:alpha/beta hydrolase family protein [Actinosynnema sp. NPDC059335]|uniref:alpha/beta hydrolase family protein n=1 Tax=Actinosynnema sp. NPDC059335 TaxID=3346804 RepID=UPI003671FC29